jgi:hypothetical protein
MKRILDRIERIQQLWKELEQTPPNTSEYLAVMKKIRVLSEEDKALMDAPKKSRESNGDANQTFAPSRKRASSKNEKW